MLRSRGTAALLFFPVALQLHLEALSAMSFVYLPLAALFVVVVLVAGIAASLMSRLRGGTTTPPLLQVAAYAVLAMFAGSVLQATQYSENTRRGTIVAHAVEAYRATHNAWPATLDVVDANLPGWRYGILRYDFIYWFEQGKPRLKFCAGGATGVSYSFDTRRWYESAL